MLLTGAYPRSFDDKQRIPLPKPIREAIGSPPRQSLLVTLAMDGALALYTEEAFTELGQRVAKASPAGAEVRAFSRMFYAQAQRVDIDGQGRIRIPAELIQLAKLGKEAVLVGVGERLELWDAAKWNAYLATMQPRFDEIAEQALRGPAS